MEKTAGQALVKESTKPGHAGQTNRDDLARSSVELRENTTAGFARAKTLATIRVSTDLYQRAFCVFRLVLP